MTESGPEVAGEDPSPPDIRPDVAVDEQFDAPDVIEVVPPVDVVSVDHAAAGIEPAQTEGQEPEPVNEVAFPDDEDGTPDGQPTTVREVERKLRVHGLFRLPDLSAADNGVARAKRQVTRQLNAVYHDTDDLRLARWGITLRRREGGEDAGWHLKLPVSGAGHGVRDELRLPLSAGDAGEIPAELSSLVTAIVRTARLRPVATLRTERTPYVLYGPDDVAFAELTDDTVSVLDGEHIAARFRELEVEALIPDAPLDPVVASLVAVGAIPGSYSKAMTALGPVTQEPSDVPKPDEVGPDDPAAAAVTAHLRRHTRAFIDNDIRVRRDLPDGVHQMRVAARRLRSGLKAFEPLVDKQWSDKLRAELGWIAGELGASRDTEVLQERIDHHADEVGEQHARLIRSVVDPVLSAQWVSARHHALGAMNSQRYRELVDALTAAAVSPHVTSKSNGACSAVLPKLVEKTWRKLENEVGKLRLDGPSDPWHEARIRAKKARYAAEAVAPVLGDLLKKLAKALSGVTEVLGEHQDAWVAQNTLYEIARRDGVDGATGFSLGLLHEFEFEQELFARTDFVDMWPSVVRAHNKARLN